MSTATVWPLSASTPMGAMIDFSCGSNPWIPIAASLSLSLSLSLLSLSLSLSTCRFFLGRGEVKGGKRGVGGREPSEIGGRPLVFSLPAVPTINLSEPSVSPSNGCATVFCSVRVGHSLSGFQIRDCECPTLVGP